MSVRSVLFLALLSGVFAAIGSLFGAVGAAFALAAAIVLAFWSYWSFGAELVRQSEARPVTDSSTLALVRVLSARAGIRGPCLYEFDEPQPNALAVGPSPDNSIILISSGLRKRLTRDELAAVLAHEIAHIRNRDVFAATLAATGVSAVFLLAVPLSLLGAALRRNGGWAIFALAILAPIGALILRCAMGRSIEYRADRDAAYLCGDPEYVVSALHRMASRSKRCQLAVREPALAAMFFIDPPPASWLERLLSSHPPIATRVHRLRALRQTQVSDHYANR